MNIEPKSLYIQDNKGAIREWSIGVLGETIIIEHGIMGGSMQQVTEKVELGRGGRTIEDQIMLQVASRISRQRDKGYSHKLEDAYHRPVNQMGFKKPMLAQPLKAVRNPNFNNAVIQPKFNGNRCMITRHNDEYIAYSRNGKAIAANLHHIFRFLNLDNGDYVDGELYCHGYSLQTIVSWIKRNQEQTKLLKFHAYDMMHDATYHERYEELKNKIDFGNHSVVIAPTYEISTIKDAWDAHKEFVNDGYEGVIIRLDGFGYEDGKRSKSLIKVKKPEDDVFNIVDIIPSKDGWARLVCETTNGIQFKASAPGDMAKKYRVYENRQLYIGRNVRIEFMNYTRDGIPFHPIATNFMD